MNEPLDLRLDTFTIVACIVIIAAFVWAWVYIARTGSSDLPKRQKWINQLPSLISTLGVLGTFVGITKGLVSFDTSDLDKSIPLLLDGLKTAFFTSLTGMAGSLILNRVVSAKFDNEANLSESERAAKMIIKAMDSNREALPKIMEESFRKAYSDNDVIAAIRGDVEQIKDDLEEVKGILQEINSSGKEIMKDVSGISAVAATATASVSAMDNNVDEIRQRVEAASESVESIKDCVESGD